MLKIDEQRLLEDLDSLAQIGATPDGGVSRPALSEDDLAGRAWFRGRVGEAGLSYQQDGAGNQSAILRSDNPDAQTLLVGSHLDTVPSGGRFDGSLGTLAALEALRTIKENGLTLPYHLEAIAFTDEEGTHIGGLFGSQAMTGELTPEKIAHPRGGRDNLLAAMQRAALTEEGIFSAKRDPATLAGWVELHIEQGTRLEEAGIDIGVVTSIVGIRSYILRFIGQAGHAGTTPMDKRKDALWGAAAFVQRARDVVIAQFSPGVVNVGQITAQPGAFNIIPGEVELALEFRHGSEDQLDAMQQTLLDIAQSVALENNLTLESEARGGVSPAPMDDQIIMAIESAAGRLDLSHTRLMSFAGHDTQAVSQITPGAMLFVPSVDGISHNPKEYTKPQDCINGTNVVLHTLLALAGVDV